MRTNELIEEAIEESYLLGLNDDEILENLDRFIDTCIGVIQTHVHDRKRMKMLAEKLAHARLINLIESRQDQDGDNPLETEPLLPGEEPLGNPLAERAARSKRVILGAIAECDPSLVARIERARFPDSPIHPPIPAPFFTRIPVELLYKLIKVGFYVSLTAALFSIYWLLFK